MPNVFLLPQSPGQLNSPWVRSQADILLNASRLSLHSSHFIPERSLERLKSGLLSLTALFPISSPSTVRQTGLLRFSCFYSRGDSFRATYLTTSDHFWSFALSLFVLFAQTSSLLVVSVIVSLLWLSCRQSDWSPVILSPFRRHRWLGP